MDKRFSSSHISLKLFNKGCWLGSLYRAHWLGCSPHLCEEPRDLRALTFWGRSLLNGVLPIQTNGVLPEAHRSKCHQNGRLRFSYVHFLCNFFILNLCHQSYVYQSFDYFSLKMAKVRVCSWAESSLNRDMNHREKSISSTVYIFHSFPFMLHRLTG